MVDLMHQMQAQIQSWKDTEDHRAIFLTCYAMMTQNMLQAATDGEFEDDQWVLSLTHTFAQYYFEALAEYENQGTPPVWTTTFETAQQRRAHVLQNLLLGVNAHICYDLIFALADSIQDEWADLSEDKRSIRYRDYCHVNEIIGATLDAVQDEVVGIYSTHMIVIDQAFGRMDEWMIHTMITRWREQVWGQSVAYTIASAADRPTLRRLYAEKAEQRCRAIRGQRGLIGIIDLF